MFETGGEPEALPCTEFDRGSRMQMTRTQRNRTSRGAREAAAERVPTWRNTRPRGNQTPDRRDVERGVEKLRTLLGR
jgi:hypothetical protein